MGKEIYANPNLTNREKRVNCPGTRKCSPKPEHSREMTLNFLGKENLTLPQIRTHEGNGYKNVLKKKERKKNVESKPKHTPEKIV